MVFNKLISLLLFPILSYGADILLFITTNSGYEAPLLTFETYQIEYDNITIPAEGYNKPLPLYTEDGQPKYTSLIFPNGRVSYDYNIDQWASALRSDQWDILDQYARLTGARMVFLNEYPSSSTGTALANTFVKSTSEKQDIIVGDGIPLAESLSGANLSTEGIFHTPTIINPNVNNTTIEPILYFAPLEPNFPEKTIAAALISRQGINIMAFYMSFGSWSKDSMALNILWVTWATRKDLSTLSNSNKLSSEDAINNISSDSLSALSSDVENKFALKIFIMLLSTVLTVLLIQI